MDMLSHLKSRGVMDRHVVHFADEEATFYLFTPTGQFSGVQYYRPLADKKKRNDEFGKYMTKSTPGYTPVFGFDQLDYSKDYCFVQEGIFDAIPLQNLGFNAVAILTYSNKQALLQLRLLFKNIYSIVDDDASGLKLGRIVDEYEVADEDVGDMYTGGKSIELGLLACKLVYKK